MQRIGTLALVTLSLVPRAAWPQGMPLGPEFRVNTYTTRNQYLLSVATDPSGNFVVVWRSNHDGSAYGVFGQRYASSGTPLGPEFRVNTYTPSYQSSPSVAVDAPGNFVVVWASNQDGSAYGIIGQRYASSGAPLGPEFRVNTYTTGTQSLPAVASDSLGNFVVVWTSFYQDGANTGIFGQRYASSGIPLGPEFRVNSYTTDNQQIPAIAADPSGNFVVVWQGFLQSGSISEVFAQRYASSGVPLGAEIRVNTFTTSYQSTASVATDPSGAFVVVWLSLGQDGSGLGVFGQRYDSSGIPLGAEFRVNTYTTGTQGRTSVGTDSSGNFVVVWASDAQDGSFDGIFGKRYAATGTPFGAEFQINTYTTGNQTRPSVSTDSSGNFVVVWGSDMQDGSGQGIFGQRFEQIVPVELLQLSVE